jgi:hypothetical protein
MKETLRPTPNLRLVSANTDPAFVRTRSRDIDNPLNQPHDATMPAQDSIMNDTVNKDWAERRLSELNGKIDLQRKDWEAEVKTMNHKFDILVADSNAKFERLFAEMKSEAKASELRIEANYQQVQAAIANAKFQIVTWVIATIIAMASLAYKNWPTHLQDPGKLPAATSTSVPVPPPPTTPDLLKSNTGQKPTK